MPELVLTMKLRASYPCSMFNLGALLHESDPVAAQDWYEKAAVHEQVARRDPAAGRAVGGADLATQLTYCDLRDLQA